MINISGYDDIIIVDREGTVIYCDLSAREHNRNNDEEMFGRGIEELYPSADEHYPAVEAAREGRAVEDFTIELESTFGRPFTKKGCAFPVFDGDESVAAIEYSTSFYDRRNLMEIESHADVPIYRKNDTKYVLDNVITGAPEMEKIKKRIEKLAITDSNVLIYGETGTGKELVAQSLHNCSRRFMRKFVSVNCGAIPSGLIEGLIFGTTRGSFTGAEDKAGYFQQAEGGTIFLDEINSLDPLLQVKILKAVETKTIRRVGSDEEVKMDVRIIASTNENPQKLIREGRLRADLYYRLAVSCIFMPPLRKRAGDVRLITDYYIDYYNRKLNMSINPPGEDVRKVLDGYFWPGNVRELRNVIEGAFAFAEDDRITLNELPSHMLREYRRKGGQPRSDVVMTGLTPADYAEEIEKRIVEEAMREAGGSITEAAELLGISKQLMSYKNRKYEG